MITFFTTGKPFVGHSGIIQRNALESWTRLGPDVEVILFGNEPGAGEVARELGIRHEAEVERSSYGSKRLDYLFRKAQESARYDILCYLNCDIVLLPDFCEAVRTVRDAHREFLMVGRRRDLEITEPFELERADWQTGLAHRAVREGRRRNEAWIDYFVFSRGLYGADMPALVVGRVFWDHWLVGKALEAKKPVVDASKATLAIHQNHDYGYHAQGKSGVWQGDEAGRNHQLSGGWRHLRTIGDATERLSKNKLRGNPRRHWTVVKRYARQAVRSFYYDWCHPIWFLILYITRPARHTLGLSAAALRRARPRL